MCPWTRHNDRELSPLAWQVKGHHSSFSLGATVPELVQDVILCILFINVLLHRNILTESDHVQQKFKMVYPFGCCCLLKFVILLFVAGGGGQVVCKSLIVETPTNICPQDVCLLWHLCCLFECHRHLCKSLGLTLLKKYIISYNFYDFIQ